MHLCCTTNQHFTTTNSTNCDEATFQASRKFSRCHKLHVSSRRHVTSIQCQQPLSSCVSKTSFIPCKEEDKLFHPRKMSKSSQNTCKHYRMFLCLSHSVVYIRVQALPRHACNALTTSYESRIIGSISPT